MLSYVRRDVMVLTDLSLLVMLRPDILPDRYTLESGGTSPTGQGSGLEQKENLKQRWESKKVKKKKEAEPLTKLYNNRLHVTM